MCQCGMAVAGASNSAPGAADATQAALENVGGAQGGVGASMMKQEGADLERTPGKGNGSGGGRRSARRGDEEEDDERGGFPRGFSASGSRRVMVVAAQADTGETTPERGQEEEGGTTEEMMTPEMDSSRSLAVYFDSEQMDRSSLVDDSPVYGSVRAELTPELGSFHMVGASDDEPGASLGALSAQQLQRQQNDKARHQRITPEKVTTVADAHQLPINSQMHADYVLGAERSHGSRRDGYITSRLFAKPLSGRDDYISNFSSPSPDVRAQANNFVGGYEITFDDVADAPGWGSVYPRGDQPEPRQFHAAAVVGRRMVVVGGLTDSGLSNDVQMLHLSKMTWTELGRGGAFGNGKAGNLKAVTPVATPGQLPLCKGHSLLSWGKTVLLVGGQLNPASDKVEVWSFDLETECWTKITAKGEIPTARSGQSVTRAGSILIMFGGETLKGQKLNDLHILDLKSLMWLPLHTMGSGPSPRTRHCATMYDDRYLLVFGGASKSKPLSDLFALDFETMEWSKMKTKGITPSPRTGHAGILIGDKWYIAGGETIGQGTMETLVLDVGNLSWSAIAATCPQSAAANQGLSLVLVQRKEKTMLVAFGGKGTELSNQVQVLYILPLDYVKNSSYSGHSEARDGQANAAVPSHSGSGLSCACVDVAKTHLSPLAEEQYGSRNSPGNSPSTESSFDLNGLVSLRRRYGTEKSKYPGSRQPTEEILSRVLKETSTQESNSPLQHFKHLPDTINPDLEMRGRLAPIATRSAEKVRKPGGSSRRVGSFDSALTSVLESAEYIESSRRAAMVTDLSTRTRSHGSGRSESLYTTTQRHSWEGEECSDSQLLADLQDAMTMERRIHLINKYRQSFEMKLSAAVRKGELAEEKLTTVMRGKEEADKSLNLALKTRQHAEGKLAASLKAQTDLKERVAAAERAQEDSNNLCNVVHSENLRLEHDLAFLKAVLEDTQKELQSTREVLATERAKSFQLQMEVFDLKNRLVPNLLTGETSTLMSDTPLTPVSENV